MRPFVLAAICGAIAITPVQAQFDINSGSGSVTLSPGEIKINGAEGKTVKLTPGGIHTTTRTQDKSISTGNPTTTVRVQTKKSGTNNLSLADKVAKIELAVYGEVRKEGSLIARVEKLEVDNLGKTYKLSVAARIDNLAKQLGVSFSGTSASASATSNVSTTRTNTVHVAASSQSSSAGALVTINDNNKQATYSCHDSSVVINSNNCRITLHGDCEQLVVNGNNNTVTADEIGTLAANGNDNKIYWTSSSSPDIANVGSRNVLQKAAK